MSLDKRGGVWRGYILAWIGGLIVLGVVFYFIYVEYFSADDLDWAQCRQSLIFRNMLPEKDLGNVISTKGILPVQCGTKTINIDYKDVKKAEREVAETISGCWYMVGEGEYKVFPGTDLFKGADTPCIVCARIHLNKNVRDYYTGTNIINIERALRGSLQGNKRTFIEYLNPPEGKRAFMYFKGWSDGGFSVDSKKYFTWAGIKDDVKAFNLPRYLVPDKGDLFVAYAEPVRVKNLFSKERGVKPYMILVQEKDFDKLSEVWVGYELSLKSKVCSSIESVPA